MNDNWDSYFCTVDERAASIVVNLGLAEEADRPGLSTLCHVSIFMREPDAEGFPGPDEEQELADMEDALVESFHAPDTGRCAGHCLTDGRMDVFFYLESGENWPENVAAVLDHFSSHEWEAGSDDDPEWEVYFDFLYPDEISMLSIQNRRACDELEESGDDPSVSRPLEHWTSFRSREDAEAFAALARDVGFAVDDISEGSLLDCEPEEHDSAWVRAACSSLNEIPEAASAWRVRLSRPDCPSDSDDVTLFLFGLADEHNGRYLGWSCASLGAVSK